MLNCFESFSEFFAVELSREDWDPVTIGEYLIEAKLGADFEDLSHVNSDPITNQIKNAQNLEGVTEDMNDEEALGKYFANDKSVEAKTINEAVMNYDPRDEQRVCKFIKSGRDCFKGNACQFDHTPLRAGWLLSIKVSCFCTKFDDLTALCCSEGLEKNCFCHLTNNWCKM